MKIGIDLTFIKNSTIHQGTYTYALGILSGLKKTYDIMSLYNKE